MQTVSANPKELVTEIQILKEKIKTLSDSESRFKTVADNAPVLIWMSETDKLCSYFNAVWLEFTGRTHEQEVGNGWADGVHPDDFEKCLEIYTTCFDKRIPFTMEYRLRRFDGQYRWILDNGAPRYGDNGEFLGYIGSCIDIHSQKLLNEELEISIKKLNRTNSELRAFNYIASHDLQEPLRKIKTYSSLITATFSESVSTVVDAYLNKLSEEANLMQRLITSLLDYTMITESKSNVEEVDLNVLLCAVQQELSEEIKKKKAKLEISELPKLQINGAQFRQVFLHLLSNSLKFGRIGVEPVIKVSVVKIDNGRTIDAVLKTGPYWEFTFSDNGTGFSDKYNELVFDLFQKLNNHNANSGGGIGLSIVKKVIESHDGLIFAHSKEDHGTTFTFYLPA
jgi:PAS domain S-box-containing protein